MKAFTSYISKHLAIFIAFIILLFTANVLIFCITFYQIIEKDYKNTAPSAMLTEIAEAMTENTIPKELEQKLSELHIWGMYLDSTGKSTWSFALPNDVPTEYSLTDIALFSRGYISDYPVFIRIMDDSLLVLGYPKNSYTKLLNNAYSLEMLKQLPFYIITTGILNLLLLFLFYFRSKRKILLSTTPLIVAIEDLSKGRHSDLNVKGELSSVAQSINQVAATLNKQNIARANWISGVSHDIRTPLSMIMGYADQIANSNNTDTIVRENARIILNQSLKLKQLIQDLNLVSQLEYDMQPFHKKTIHLAKLLRSYTADLLNNGLEDSYQIEIHIDADAEKNVLQGDERLLTRAINNLIQNSICHNPDGCDILITLRTVSNKSILSISDNGIGLTKNKLADLQERPHYMQSTDERLDLRHGLGLLIVKQVVTAHNGSITYQNMEPHGFEANIVFETN